MVTHPPVVADPRILIDHQGIDFHLPQTGRDGEAVLAAANDQNLGIAVRERARLIALLQPVQPAEIPRICVATGPAGARVFLVAFQLIERSHQHPGPIGCRGWQADHAEAAAGCGFKAENSLVHLDAKTAYDARRRAALRQRKPMRTRRFLRRGKNMRDRRRAFRGLNRPRERQHIAIMALLSEQRRDPRRIARGQRGFEPPKPLRGRVASPRHGRFFHCQCGGIVHGRLPRLGSVAKNR